MGTLIPVPNVQNTNQLQADIRALKGQPTLVESTLSGWGSAQTSNQAADYNLRRVGANPPATLSALRRDVEESILAACGVPASLVGRADGTLAREDFRRFLHLTIGPVARELAGQIAARFDLPGFAFNFDSLFAGDLSGRARAFQSMVGGGMSVEEAARLAGLMVD